MFPTDIQAHAAIFTMGLITPKAVSLFQLFTRHQRLRCLLWNQLCLIESYCCPNSRCALQATSKVPFVSVKRITQQTVFLSSITQPTEGCFLGSILNCTLDRRSIALPNVPCHKAPGNLSAIRRSIHSGRWTKTILMSDAVERLH